MLEEQKSGQLRIPLVENQGNMGYDTALPGHGLWLPTIVKADQLSAGGARNSVGSCYDLRLLPSGLPHFPSFLFSIVIVTLVLSSLSTIIMDSFYLFLFLCTYIVTLFSALSFIVSSFIWLLVGMHKYSDSHCRIL